MHINYHKAVRILAGLNPTLVIMKMSRGKIKIVQKSKPSESVAVGNTYLEALSFIR